MLKDEIKKKKSIIEKILTKKMRASKV